MAVSIIRAAISSLIGSLSSNAIKGFYWVLGCARKVLGFIATDLIEY
jgi:hypothetical protein